MPSYSVLGSRKNILIVATCAILGVQASASRMLSFSEVDTASPQLREIPMTMGPWSAGAEGSLDAGIVDYLKPDDYILRDYSRAGAGPKLNLFVAHFKSLQKTYGPH